MTTEPHMSHSHYHGATELDKELEARPELVRENRVPNPHDVGQWKLLAEQQRQPPEAVVLQVQILVPQPTPHRVVSALE